MSLELNAHSDVNRRECPHHAVITFKIDIRKINSDGTIDPQVLGNALLRKYGISTKAQLAVAGTSEADCINNLKSKLERLNE